MINVPEQFRPHIVPVYPPNNEIIFEEWFAMVYNGCKTDREFLGIHFTSYWVNNDYGNNQQKRIEIQEYADSLSRNKKWFCVTQYDDSVLIDFKDLDVLRFEMSKNIGVQIPLLCQPHPYKFTSGKKLSVSFVGSKTHPVRNELDKFKNLDGYLISYEPHGIENYCRILQESIFSLCPRGYGLNSFRVAESLQYGSIPVIISDEFIIPFGIDLKEFCVLIKSEDVNSIPKILDAYEPIEIIEMQEAGKLAYQEYYTYDGALRNIIKCLEQEYAKA